LRLASTQCARFHLDGQQEVRCADRVLEERCRGSRLPRCCPVRITHLRNHKPPPRVSGTGGGFSFGCGMSGAKASGAPQGIISGE
jgi:hypothetical protein